jgi:hypothetical protein
MRQTFNFVACGAEHLGMTNSLCIDTNERSDIIIRPARFLHATHSSCDIPLGDLSAFLGLSFPPPQSHHPKYWRVNSQCRPLRLHRPILPEFFPTLRSLHVIRPLHIPKTAFDKYLSYITSTSDFTAIEPAVVVAVHHRQRSLARIARRLPTGWTWMQDSGLTPWPSE